MKLSKMIALIGVVFIIGTAGACDLNDISLKTAVVRAAIGVLCIAFGALLQKTAQRTAEKKTVKHKKTVSITELKKAV